MSLKMKGLLLFLAGWICPMMLQASELPSGILVTKASPSAPNTQASGVIEYVSITEHLIPTTDYITVKKPDGSLDMVPKNLMKLEGRNATGMMKLSDALEEHDDVQNVYSNFDVDEDDESLA